MGGPRASPPKYSKKKGGGNQSRFFLWGGAEGYSLHGAPLGCLPLARSICRPCRFSTSTFPNRVYRDTAAVRPSRRVVKLAAAGGETPEVGFCGGATLFHLGSDGLSFSLFRRAAVRGRRCCMSIQICEVRTAGTRSATKVLPRETETRPTKWWRNKTSPSAFIDIASHLRNSVGMEQNESAGIP